MSYENMNRQYFALDNTGDVWSLGDCGDFDAAEEIADDLGIQAVWIADAVTAKQWAKVITNKIEIND